MCQGLTIILDAKDMDYGVAHTVSRRLTRGKRLPKGNPDRCKCSLSFHLHSFLYPYTKIPKHYADDSDLGVVDAIGK